MKTLMLSEGEGRAKVELSTHYIGEDLVVCLFNGKGHLGAVAVSDYSAAEERTSTSVITRLGHKDDAVAYNAARKICKRIKKPVCAIAGIHVDDITAEEISRITENCEKLIERFLSTCGIQEKP